VIQLSIVVASATLAVGLATVLALRLLPTVRLQLAGLAFLAVVLPLSAVLLSGWVMFHMGADVKILAVASASASVAIGAALALAWSIAARMRELERTSRKLAAGDLSARARVAGPRELEELARATNEMAENVERLFDARRQLVAWASHDLRTPLSSLQAMLEAIEDGLVEPAQYLPAMGEQVDRLRMLIDDLFELARIDAESSRSNSAMPPFLEWSSPACADSRPKRARGMYDWRRGSRAACRPYGARRSRSSECSSICSQTRFGIRRRTDRS